MTQSEMLLVQPLNLDEINLKLKDDEEEQEQKDQVDDTTVIIDDVELLAILGIPSLTNTAANSPVDEQGILDWDDIPSVVEPQNKRKREEEEFDIFAQFDFVDAVFPVNKKQIISL